MGHETEPTLHEASDAELRAEVERRADGRPEGVPADVLDMPAGAEVEPGGDLGEDAAGLEPGGE